MASVAPPIRSDALEDKYVGTAATMDGRHAWGLDQTALSQKAGPVVSDVRISRTPNTRANKAGFGQVDLLLGFDALDALDGAPAAPAG